MMRPEISESRNVERGERRQAILLKGALGPRSGPTACSGREDAAVCRSCDRLALGMEHPDIGVRVEPAADDAGVACPNFVHLDRRAIAR